jgi:NitT/TauT family transport system ATP-binding protein
MDVLVESVRQVWEGRHGAPVIALDGVTHRFQSGRFSCVLGPSGCGKSTLAQIIGGLEHATSGRVEMRDPGSPSATIPDGAASVMVWQSQNLFPWRTVIDNVAFGLQMSGLAKRERYDRASALLATVGLQGFEHHYPAQLSGGMRQRVALARALIMERPVMLMDEPFGALDAQTKIVMQEELLRIFEVTRKTIIFITHAIDEAILLGDEVIVMTSRPGRIKEVMEVNLPRPRTLEMVNTPEFGALFDRAFHSIRDEVRRAMAEQSAAIRGAA